MNKGMENILFITNIPSPYRVAFFNLLADKVNLTVIYERASASDRQKAWKSNERRKYHEIFLRGWNIGAESSIAPEILRYLKKGIFDHIVIAGYSSPTMMVAITLCRLRKIPYWLSSDGALFHTDSGWKQHLKRFLIGGAEKCLCTGESTRKYLAQYIAPEKCLIFPFSSLHERDILPRVPSPEEKAELRRRLGMNEPHIIVGAGRCIPRKGVDVLLKVAERLNTAMGFYWIGDTPSPQLSNFAAERNLRHVHFLKFMPYRELARYYRAADLFVLPTREDPWGLVVHEAMANGLPVITTRNCVAGLEMVKPGISGDLVESDHPEMLAHSIVKFLNNRELRETAAARSLETSRQYTLEKMAESHVRYFQTVGHNQ